MIAAFEVASTGRFDVTLADLHKRGKGFKPGASAAWLRRSLPGLFERAERELLNVIIRPRSSRDCRLVQLDDLKAPQVRRVKDCGFLVLETSPANYQVWLSVQGGDAQLARRCKRGIGADPGASGAVKLAGTLNFKPQYAPAYPRVRVIESHPEAPFVTADALEAAGWLAKPVPTGELLDRIGYPGPPPNAWPDYQRCLNGAPVSRDTGEPDRSRADYTWAKIALQKFRWIRSPERVAKRLYGLSEKAQERGPIGGMEYCRITVDSAMSAVWDEMQRQHAG